jgi:hypothetical protein
MGQTNSTASDSYCLTFGKYNGQRLEDVPPGYVACSSEVTSVSKIPFCNQPFLIPGSWRFLLSLASTRGCKMKTQIIPSTASRYSSYRRSTSQLSSINPPRNGANSTTSGGNNVHYEHQFSAESSNPTYDEQTSQIPRRKRSYLDHGRQYGEILLPIR